MGRGCRPGLSVLMSLMVSRTGLSLSLICQPTSEDIKQHDRTAYFYKVQELCESRGGRPGLSTLTSLMVPVDVKQY